MGPLFFMLEENLSTRPEVTGAAGYDFDIQANEKTFFLFSTGREYVFAVRPFLRVACFLYPYPAANKPVWHEPADAADGYRRMSFQINRYTMKRFSDQRTHGMIFQSMLILSTGNLSVFFLKKY